MNNTLLKSVVLVAVGLVAGWLIWGGSPFGMHSAMNSMTGALHGKTGEEFDKAFLSEMIVHHEGAVMMAEMVLKQSARPELQQLAADIINAQNAEIVQMKAWLKAWF